MMLEYQADVAVILRRSRGEVRFRLDRVAVHGTVRHLSLVFEDNARHEDVVLEVPADPRQVLQLVLSTFTPSGPASSHARGQRLKTASSFCSTPRGDKTTPP